MAYLLSQEITKNTKGTVLIEMAIVLPVLLFIILGGIEIGIYFFKQHIVARTIDSVIVPLQLNPKDSSREIEMLVRKSGMGIIDFSVNNNAGNYICVRAYKDLSIAQRNLCSVNKGENGWRPDPFYWGLNQNKPYYIAIVAHVEYKGLTSIGGFLPAIKEWHVFQITPTAVSMDLPIKLPQPTNALSANPLQNQPQNPPPPPVPNGNNNQEINSAIKDLQEILHKSPMFRQ